MTKKVFVVLIVILSLFLLIGGYYGSKTYGKVKKDVIVDTAYYYIDQVEMYLVTQSVLDESSKQSFTMTEQNSDIVIVFRGKKPTAYILKIKDNLVTEGYFDIDGYHVEIIDGKVQTPVKK